MRPGKMEDNGGMFQLKVDVRFRSCRRDDLEALEWMGLHSGDRALIAATFAEQERGAALMLVAEAQGFPIAQAWLDFAERGTFRRPHIWAVRVFWPLQGAGLGTRLIAEAEAQAVLRGAAAIELGVEWANGRARRFYQRLGYRFVRRTPPGEQPAQLILGKELATPGREASAPGSARRGLPG